MTKAETVLGKALRTWLAAFIEFYRRHGVVRRTLALLDETGRIASIATRDWAIIG